MSTKPLPWFRAYTEMVDDAKLRLLAFEDRWHFVALLCCKGDGLLDAGDDPTMLRRKLAVKLGLAGRELEEVARRLAEVGLIDFDTMQPIAWAARQMRSDTDPTAADRKRRQRERERHVTDGSRVTVTEVTRTDTEVDTDTEQEARAGTKAAPRVALADLFPGVDPQVLADFKILRTKLRAPITPTAAAGIRREAEKAGVTVQHALAMCCERGWRGFKADWAANTTGATHAAREPRVGLADRHPQQPDRAGAIEGTAIRVDA